ncbi:MAG: LPS export ABC transporter periplasmic protein LptC [bacterium]|nr:LPS export ABC transporter periplasmic protein LptC [bacterium]
MNIAKQTFLLFFILIILGTSRWYLTSASFNSTLTLDDDTLASTIDTTITQLTVRQYNGEGVLINLLKTPLMEHIPKGDIHLLQTPRIIINQKDQPAWEIHSKKAKSFDGGQRIIFSQQVVVHQKAGIKSQESTLKTEEVTYYPKEKKATTNLFVTFEQPGNFVESTGMNAYLDEKRVELLHRAKGSYAPSTKG